MSAVIEIKVLHPENPRGEPYMQEINFSDVVGISYCPEQQDYDLGDQNSHNKIFLHGSDGCQQEIIPVPAGDDASAFRMPEKARQSYENLVMFWKSTLNGAAVETVDNWMGELQVDTSRPEGRDLKERWSEQVQPQPVDEHDLVVSGGVTEGPG